MTHPIVIVQGGAWGSESKGSIAAYLCVQDKIDVVVRTGATNAGHSVIYGDTKIAMQQLPTGWIRPETILVLGAGSLIDPVCLEREVAEITRLTGRDIRERLKIDRRAALHVPAHAARSKDSGRHHAIGATGKGCSEALVDRIKSRGDPSYHLFGDSAYSKGYDVCDTEAYLNYAWNEGARILLEGTQGQLLDLYLGPYPYTTHKQTGPAQWMLEAGLSPALPTEIHMVVRTYPIRVAGNSGPMPQEISWPQLARSINVLREHAKLDELVPEWAIRDFETAVTNNMLKFRLPRGSNGLDQHTWSPEQRVEFREALSELHKEALHDLPPETIERLLRLFEMTTVTKKLRRIACLDRQSLVDSARQMRPHFVDITFMNYMFPQHWFKIPERGEGDQDQEMLEFTRWIEETCHAPVRLVSFGPRSDHSHIVDRRLRPL